MCIGNLLLHAEMRLPQVENALTVGAAVPILGVVPAAAKIILGIAQVVAGIAFILFDGIMNGLSGLYKSYKDEGAASFGARHIVHGLANIAAGAVEAIPLVGTISLLVRLRKAENIKEFVMEPIAAMESQFIQYKGYKEYIMRMTS